MSGPIAQAVILAGGRGVRLRPLTDNLPKPLIPFHGRPFISYLLDQLIEQGVERVLLLTGYLGRLIEEYCGDGSQWGLEIRCLGSSVANDTGRRIKLAEGQLDPHFLLMYCDNYWPMSLNSMWDAFCTAGAQVQLTAYTNQDSYSRDNLKINLDGRIIKYDKNRSQPGLAGVDIGYAIVDRDALELLPNENVNFELALYPTLAARGLLYAYSTNHRYYSVGSHERLATTEAFLKPQKAIILDRDGVLNERPAQAEYVKSWEEFHWISGAKEALITLKKAGYTVALATNQSGIARGVMTLENLKDVHRQMNDELRDSGVELDAIYFCPHGWDDGCYCRKPHPGMLFEAQRDFHLDLTKTLFVGDDERDQQAGQAAGCLTELVSEDRPLLTVVHDYLSGQSQSSSPFAGDSG